MNCLDRMDSTFATSPGLRSWFSNTPDNTAEAVCVYSFETNNTFPVKLYLKSLRAHLRTGHDYLNWREDITVDLCINYQHFVNELALRIKANNQ